MSLTTRIAARTALGVLAIAVAASTAQGQGRDERAIRAASEQWQRDIAAQNVDAIVALHTSDAVVMMSHAPVCASRSHLTPRLSVDRRRTRALRKVSAAWA